MTEEIQTQNGTGSGEEVKFEPQEEWGAERDNALITIRNLNKTYVTDDSSTVAIEDFSIDIDKGELISIVGPSGCGKTTTPLRVPSRSMARNARVPDQTAEWSSRTMPCSPGGP